MNNKFTWKKNINDIAGQISRGIGSVSKPHKLLKLEPLITLSDNAVLLPLSFLRYSCMGNTFVILDLDLLELEAEELEGIWRYATFRWEGAWVLYLCVYVMHIWYTYLDGVAEVNAKINGSPNVGVQSVLHKFMTALSPWNLVCATQSWPGAHLINMN